MRQLNHQPGREVFIQHDYDFVSTVYYKDGGMLPVFFYKEPSGQFTGIFEPGYNDWYMLVAIEKFKKITVDTHLITTDLLLRYRWAIREGFNHQLDTKLRNQYDHPANKNTIAGVIGYIEGIKKKSDAEMRNL